MNHIRIAAGYTLLLFALGVGAGIVIGIVERLLGVDRHWGELNAAMIFELVTIIALALGVFAALAKRHPERYFAVGWLIVLFNVPLQLATAYAVAPQSVRQSHNWFIASFVPLVLNAAAFAIVGALHRLRQSSSNTSLERTRDR